MAMGYNPTLPKDYTFQALQGPNATNTGFDLTGFQQALGLLGPGDVPGASGSSSGGGNFSGSNLVPSAQSPEEKLLGAIFGTAATGQGSNPTGRALFDFSQGNDLLSQMFNTASTGQGTNPTAQMLFSLGQGQLPTALSDQLKAQTAEQFGATGNRFGTDLATATGRGLTQASESQALNAIGEISNLGQISGNQRLNALQQILGLGGTTAGFQFQRGENALDRALKEFLSQQSQDPLMALLLALGGSGGGSTTGA